MLSDSLITTIASGGSGAIFVAIVYLAGKVVDRWKPLSERKSFERQQIEQLQKDVGELRTALSNVNAERHHFYQAINDCIVLHPETGAFWTDRLQHIRDRIS